MPKLWMISRAGWPLDRLPCQGGTSRIWLIPLAKSTSYLANRGSSEGRLRIERLGGPWTRRTHTTDGWWASAPCRSQIRDMNLVRNRLGEGTDQPASSAARCRAEPLMGTLQELGDGVIPGAGITLSAPRLGAWTLRKTLRIWQDD